ncbi:MULTISPECIES: hypothetical protein [Sphingomonadales]|uniref:Uncharacterized protein n=4 Tax=Sphingomonadaceae TaxID=41297 RepID=A0A8E0WNY4_9SPHN|nr:MULTISPECIES: hypothetical protein [Sphingomonadaceae]EPR15569.1 hypothetical protein M527_24485 [Sphingobium indicum IP26]MBW7950545.1 hypothetical protein [Pseudorhodoplanes sp.]AMK20630.1 hypothetical protein K663_21373 [Sphingobium sp. MI1205]AMK21273.1 hypothetical protein K426_01560 [Sphingobium sp. TKS]EQB19662.1 hypothetical protein RLDS_00010 [Sphingobium lactosutens DS20]
MATEIDLSSPQARRRAKTDARLREALAGLAGNPSAEPTVAALARAAGVGRNIIYTHHAGVLDGLRALQSQRAGANETTAREADRTRSALRDAEARSAALATHNASLLKRAVDAEQRAERLERRNAQLVQELDRIRRPIPIRPSAEAHDPSAV